MQKSDFSMELLRKAIHVIAGIFVVLAVETRFLTTGTLGALIVVLGAIVLFNYRYEKELLTRVLSLNRADKKVPGLDVLAFFLGCWIVLAIFPHEIAFASILILTFGDPVAHLISTGFGGKEAAVTRTSYFEGTVAGTIVGALAGWIYVGFFPALIASAAAMFVESGELRIASHHIDDNFTIPIVAGLVLWVIALAF